MGTLTDILHSHYGPGIDRRSATDGVSGFAPITTEWGWTGLLPQARDIGQYPPEVASVYESLAACPDDYFCLCTTCRTRTGCTRE